MCQKSTDRMTNIVDLDHTLPLEAVWSGSTPYPAWPHLPEETGSKFPQSSEKNTDVFLSRPHSLHPIYAKSKFRLDPDISFYSILNNSDYILKSENGV